MAQTNTETKLVLGVNGYGLVVIECAGQITAVNTRESQKISLGPWSSSQVLRRDVLCENKAFGLAHGD